MASIRAFLAEALSHGSREPGGLVTLEALHSAGEVDVELCGYLAVIVSATLLPYLPNGW